MMDIEKIYGIGYRILFSSSLILLIVAVGERVANLAGYTFLRQTPYSPWRLMEFTLILLLFVIALLLRQIREELRQPRNN